MPYVIQAYDRQGNQLAECRPIEWTGRWGLSAVGNISGTVRFDDPSVAALRDVNSTQIVVREQVGGSAPVRLVAEVMNAARGRDADGGGTLSFSAKSPEHRWERIILGNVPGPRFIDALNQKPNVPPVLVASGAYGATPPLVPSTPDTIDRVEAASRLILATSYLSLPGEQAYDATHGLMHWDVLGLRRASIREPGYFNVPSHDPGILLGSLTPCGGTIVLAPEDLQRQTAAAIMARISGGLDGFEWWMTYADAPMVRPAGPNASRAGGASPDRVAAWTMFNAAASRGQNLPDVVYEYGAGAANVDSFTETLDGDSMANSWSVLPVGAPAVEIDTTANGNTAAVSASVPALVTRYGQLDGVLAPEANDYDMRGQIALEATLLGSVPRQTITLDPAARGSGAPWPFIDFNAGDRVRFVSWERDTTQTPTTGAVTTSDPVAKIDASLRVYGFSISVDGDGVESSTVTLIDDGTT